MFQKIPLYILQALSLAFKVFAFNIVFHGNLYYQYINIVNCETYELSGRKVNLPSVSPSLSICSPMCCNVFSSCGAGTTISETHGCKNTVIKLAGKRTRENNKINDISPGKMCKIFLQHVVLMIVLTQFICQENICQVCTNKTIQRNHYESLESYKVEQENN